MAEFEKRIFTRIKIIVQCFNMFFFFNILLYEAHDSKTFLFYFISIRLQIYELKQMDS